MIISISIVLVLVSKILCDIDTLLSIAILLVPYDIYGRFDVASYSLL